jgi:formiminotetrahydrofolate cyclodeaminase
MDKFSTISAFACFMTSVLTFSFTMAVYTSRDAEYKRIHDRIDNMYKEFFELIKEKK